MAQLIDGKAISAQIKEEVKEKVAALKEQGREVTLAVIQVGADPASSVYVRNKKKACEYVGVRSLAYELPEETTEEKLLELIREMNDRTDVNGILVQLPLPKHIDEEKVLDAISPLKDVDGFHPQNVGALCIGKPGFVSCTPAGVIQLLKRSGIEIAGKECVVVGRSNIVGKPMALLLLRENGTVTVAHSRTKDLKEVTKRADILVVAVGKPKMITAEYVKEGAVVIDVGIHRNEENGLVEPAGVAGAVEHQRHIRDAGKRQRIVRIVKRQDAHTQIIAPHHQRVVLFRGQLLRPQSCCLSRCKTKFCRIASLPCFLCTAKGIQHTARVNAGRAKHMGQPQPAQQRIRGRLRREKAGLPCKAAHRLSSRKCHSRMLPAMPAFRLSTRSVMGMRTVLLQAAMVSSVRP